MILGLNLRRESEEAGSAQPHDFDFHTSSRDNKKHSCYKTRMSNKNFINFQEIPLGLSQLALVYF